MDRLPVISPSGQFGTIESSELQAALQAGYRQPTPEQIAQMEAREAAGTSGQALIGLGESALSTATFGLSAQAEKALGVSPEAMKLREEENPFLTGVVGPAMGIAGSLLVGPEAGALKAIGVAGEAAAGGVGASKAAQTIGKYLPVNMAAKTAEVISEKVAPTVAKGASIVANPETRPIVNKILTGAGSMATGSAVEGALYGLGQAVHEDALGDPDALGDKLVAHLGFGAAINGGLGAIVGAGKGAFQGLKETRGQAILPSEAQKLAGGDFEAAARASDAPKSKIDEAVDYAKELTNFQKLKPEAKRLVETGERYGLTPTAGQLSDNKSIRFMDDWLTNSASPSVAANTYASKAQEQFRKAAQVVKDTVGADVERMTELEAGRALQASLSEKMAAEYKATGALFDYVAPYLEAIPANERGVNQMVKALQKSEELVKRPHLEGSKFLARFLDMFERVETLKDIEELRKSIFRELTAFDNANTRKIAGEMYYKLDDAVERYLEKFAETMKTEKAGQEILDRLTARRAAKAAFREYMETYGPVIEGLGGRSIKTGAELGRFVEEMNPQKLLKRAFQRGDIEFTQDLQKRFPDIFKIIRDHEVGKIVDKVSKNTKSGDFNPTAFLKEYRKTAPEIRDLLYTKEQQKVLDDMEFWFSSYPEKFNPSQSGYAVAGQEALKSVAGLGVANARDSIMKSLIDYAMKTGDVVTAQRQLALRNIEKSSQSISNKIEKGIRGIITGGHQYITVEGLREHEAKPGEHEKMVAMIQNFNANPELFLDKITAETADMYDAAPKITQATQAALARANAFMASKVPNTPQSGILSAPYQASKAETSKMLRYYNAIQNPLSILIQAQNGTITPEAVEAVRTVYPSIMDEIKMKTIEELTKKHDKAMHLPLTKKLGLSMLLGEDLMNALGQSNLMMNQQSLANPGAQQSKNLLAGQAKLSQSGMSNVTLAHRSMTEVAQAANRKLS